MRFLRCTRLCLHVAPTATARISKLVCAEHSRFTWVHPCAAAASVFAAGFIGSTLHSNCKERTGFLFEPRPDKFSPLYLKDPERNTAACNAGDYLLYLGGGSINGAFGKLLEKEQGLAFLGDHPKAMPVQTDYQDLHALLLKASRERGGKMVVASELPNTSGFLKGARLTECFAVAGEAFGKEDPRFEAAVGSAFIDVFEEASRPLHQRNVAMLYVVGPKGEGGFAGQGPLLPLDTFLASVERLGRHALQLVVDYNTAQVKQDLAHQLPFIDEVRWCLVSGGVYRHSNASKLDVASATLRGMMRVGGNKPMITFTYDEDVFQRAYLHGK